MSKKRYLLLLFVLLCIHVFPCDAFYAETYRIENSRVLLYKIINWWYDCLPDECDLFCGKIVECDNRGNAEIQYDASDMTLRLRVRGGFAELFSVFKTCKDCYGPAFLECRQSNRKYFGSGKAAGINIDFQGFTEFIFNGIRSARLQSLKEIKEEITFILYGKVGGLVGGKVALHQVGRFQRSCPENPKNRKTPFPISFKIVNIRTDEVLAIYETVWNND
jgi:hypothetical protein